MTFSINSYAINVRHTQALQAMHATYHAHISVTFPVFAC